MTRDSRFPIYASIGANIAIGTSKLTAAAFTGSSAMVAEGIHSLVDSMDGTLLLVGRSRSRRPPDDRHPFGYGQELYFWSLMVAVLFFTIGGGASIFQGIAHIQHPPPPRDPLWNYVVLGAASLFDGTSFLIGFHAFRKRARGRGVIEQLRRSKDPSLFTVVLEDTADLAGIALAFLGVWFSHRLGMPYLDGVASIAVGLVLGVVALVLLVQTKSLLIGEAAEPSVVAAIRRVVASDPSVVRELRPLTVHLGPHEILVALVVDFSPELRQRDVTRAIRQLESKIRDVAPDVRQIFIAIASQRS
ncbi:MAG: cation diffusion facilitator family transporter [Gemmatimonadota bacterium]|nr:cation diffusion facilitator family transporter [Gemmatimonadota bacterium]